LENRKFDEGKLEKLNDPSRLDAIPPGFIWNTLSLDKCNTIIDIGAGTGLFSLAFHSLMKNGRVYAADISGLMLDWIEKNVHDGNPDIIPLKMDEASVPLEDGVADLVVMIALHHELLEPVSLLKEAHRLLRRGGKICIVDWKRGNTRNGPPRDIRISPQQIARQLNDAGFSEIRSNDDLEMHSFLYADK
jgi:SAM-dependent methyltransferase